MLKNIILCISTIIILVIFNINILLNNTFLKTGEDILLPLEIKSEPTRAFMLGDYKSLSYTISTELLMSNPNSFSKNGFLVIATDKDLIAHFVRIYHGEKLAPNEKLIKYQMSSNIPTPLPNKFYISEGQHDIYKNAAYAILHYQGSKNYMLIGLADANRIKLK